MVKPSDVAPKAAFTAPETDESIQDDVTPSDVAPKVAFTAPETDESIQDDVTPCDHAISIGTSTFHCEVTGEHTPDDNGDHFFTEPNGNTFRW